MPNSLTRRFPFFYMWPRPLSWALGALRSNVTETLSKLKALGIIIDKAASAVAYAKEAAKTIDYATNTYDTNLNKDLPNYINAQGNPMLGESNGVLDDLYYQILPMVRNAASNIRTIAVNCTICSWLLSPCCALRLIQMSL